MKRMTVVMVSVGFTVAWMVGGCVVEPTTTMVCTPGEKVCSTDAKSVRTCKSDGSGFTDSASCGAGCSAGACSGRHIKAQLKYGRKTTMLHGGQQVAPMAMLHAQLRAQPALRASKSPAFLRSVASQMRRIDAEPMAKPRPALVQPGSERTTQGAFDVDVAVFAYDDSSGVWLDSQYLDVDTGAYDLGVSTTANVSLWYGTYDDNTSMATIVLPATYGFDTSIPPGSVDVTYDYDAYFWSSTDPGYSTSTANQAGYYQIDWVTATNQQGTSYAYMLPDNPSVGSYYFIWDDGVCTSGTHVYVAFDSRGSYFTINGVDAPFSMSGITTTTGYFEGDVRWNVVGNDGYNYAVTANVTYLADAPPTAYVCPTTTLVVPLDPTESMCPAGCSVDAYFGICTVDGTLDVNTGIGLSCDLAVYGGDLIVCASGCSLASDGFCYDTAGYICY